MANVSLTITRRHYLAYFSYFRSCIGPGMPHALPSGATTSEKKPHQEKVGLKVFFRIFGHRIARHGF